MDLVQTSEAVANLYEYFYQITANYNDYAFDPNDKECSMINNFVNWLDKKYKLQSVGWPILLKYFFFQFNYWHQKQTRFDGKIMLGWVIGPKAQQRWIEIENRGKIDFLVNVYFTNKKNISFTSILNHFSPRKVSFDMLLLNDVEEIEKRRYYNDPELGLASCVLSTTLFNKHSLLCITCHFKTSCRILLQENYPNIAKQRL